MLGALSSETPHSSLQVLRCALLFRWMTRRRRDAVVDHDRTE